MQHRGWAVRTVIVAGVMATVAPTPATAQQGGATGGATGGGTATTSGSTTRTPSQSNSTTAPNDTNSQRPIFISGKVLLSDGSPLTERAKIERVCNGTVKIETYTDSKGRFNFEVGRSFELPDASSGGPDPSASGPFGGRSGGAGGFGGLGGLGGLGGGASSTTPERQLWGCDLRANLAGFRSDMISLSNIHYMDNPDVGAIILHRLAKVDGLTISATSLLAPKDARKAYDKGMEATRKKNPDTAQASFEKAVALYPRYAAAWVGLGKLQEQRDHLEEARMAYQQAVTADGKYIEPYERLAYLALKANQWEELANSTAQYLRLDPFNNANLHYLNGVANFQLKRFDLAEKSAREAIRLDAAKQNPRSIYVLGLVQAQQQDFAGAATSLRAFLEASPGASDADTVRKQLSQVEEFARLKALPAPAQ